MNNEDGRVRFGDVKNRRGVAPDLRMGGVILAEEVVQELQRLVILMNSKVHWPAGIDNVLTVEC